MPVTTAVQVDDAAAAYVGSQAGTRCDESVAVAGQQNHRLDLQKSRERQGSEFAPCVYFRLKYTWCPSRTDSSKYSVARIRSDQRA